MSLHGGFRHDATADWFEGNYLDTIYMAETWNCLSNIAFVMLAIFGMIYTKGLPERARYAWTHAGVAFIGVGSFIFHATLSWHAQVLLDELPMIFAVSQELYCVTAAGGSTTRSFKLINMSISIIISTIYLIWPNIIFHQVCYFCLQISTYYLLYYMLQELPLDIPAPARLRREATSLIQSGFALTALAFAIWNVDNIFCDDITRWRESEIPRWLGVLSQGHAWWHIIIAIGVNRTLTGLTGLSVASTDFTAGEFRWVLNFFPYFHAIPKGTGQKAH